MINRRQLIKGIGAAICAGLTPKFVRELVPAEPEYKMWGDVINCKGRPLTYDHLVVVSRKTYEWLLTQYPDTPRYQPEPAPETTLALSPTSWLQSEHELIAASGLTTLAWDEPSLTKESFVSALKGPQTSLGSLATADYSLWKSKQGLLYAPSPKWRLQL